MAVPARVPPADGSQAADAAAAAAVASEAAWTQTRALLRSILVILFVAAALWLLSFGAWAWRYVPMYLSARIDAH